VKVLIPSRRIISYLPKRILSGKKILKFSRNYSNFKMQATAPHQAMSAT
jgi:hypothetical protein